MSPAPSRTLESSLVPLLEAYGPPGREEGVRALLRRLLRGAGSFTEDVTGNLHLRRPGAGPRLLLTAHMDATGIILTRVDAKSGQARLAILGGRRPAELVGAAVRFEDRRRGIVAWERKNGAEPEVDQLVLETGSAGGARGARAGVGDVGAIEDEPFRLGDYWCAANLDNRAGCAALVAALTARGRSGYDLHAVFTAQSDLGARGAMTGAFGVDPELAVVVDVAHLGEPKETSGFALGKGPCVALKEQGFLAHPRMLELVRAAARAARIPLQYLIREGEGSDARAVRAARTGVPTAVLAIPARRTGGLRSIVHASDLTRTAELIAAILAGTGEPKRGAARGAKTRARRPGAAGSRSKRRAATPRPTKRGGRR